MAPILLGLAITLATSAVPQQTVERYADIDACTAGCDAAAAGWPLPYLVDDPGVSPVRSVSLSGGVLGIDRWRMPAFVFDLAVWTTASAGLIALARRTRR